GPKPTAVGGLCVLVPLLACPNPVRHGVWSVGVGDNHSQGAARRRLADGPKLADGCGCWAACRASSRRASLRRSGLVEFLLSSVRSLAEVLEDLILFRPALGIQTEELIGPLIRFDIATGELNQQASNQRTVHLDLNAVFDLTQ